MEMTRRPNNHCSSFIKDEFYTELKAPRAINSYPDGLKWELGPFVKSLEKCFFSHPFFVKGMTNGERDDMLRMRMGDGMVGFTDFSSFECHHEGVYAEMFIEFVDYLRGGRCEKEFGVMKELVLGTNLMRFSKAGVVAEMPQRLMSGALWTSFQNSFLNLMCLKYLRYRCVRNQKFDFNSDDTMVEGDDGIFRYFRIREKYVTRLGLKLKIEAASHYSRASFCGRVVTESACVCDPIKTIIKLCWHEARFGQVKDSTMRSLIKAKAMSYLDMYNGSPVVTKLCAKLVNELRNIDERVAIKHLRDDFHRYDIDKEMIVKEPTIVERNLVRDMFGMSIMSQIQCEQAIDEWNFGQDLRLPINVPISYVQNVYEHIMI